MGFHLPGVLVKGAENARARSGLRGLGVSEREGNNDDAARLVRSTPAYERLLRRCSTGIDPQGS